MTRRTMAALALTVLLAGCGRQVFGCNDAVGLQSLHSTTGTCAGATGGLAAGQPPPL